MRGPAGATAVGMEVVASLGAFFGQLAMVEAAVHPDVRVGESLVLVATLIRREWRATQRSYRPTYSKR